MTAPSDLKELLARVEKATENSINLFLEVAIKTIPDAYPSGWVLDKDLADWRFLKFEKYLGAGAFNDASLALVERVLPGWDYCLSKGFGEPALAALAPSDQAIGVEVTAPTPALAVCAAPLKALIAKENADA